MVVYKEIIVTCLLALSVSGESGGGVKGQWTTSGKDSYLKAVDHSSGLKVTHPPTSYYYHLYPQQTHQYPSYGQQKTGDDYYSYGGGDGLNGISLDEADPKVDPVTSLGGLFSLATAGLSSLSWVTTGILAIILAPILLPIILSPLILIGLIIYFIPVIRLELGPDGTTTQRRSGGRVGEAMKHLEVTGRLLYSLSANEECLERVACEMGRASSLPSLSKWIKSKLDAYQNPIVRRLSRALRLSTSPLPDCKMFGCDPGRQFRRLLKSIGQEGK